MMIRDGGLLFLGTLQRMSAGLGTPAFLRFAWTPNSNAVDSTNRSIK